MSEWDSQFELVYGVLRVAVFVAAIVLFAAGIVVGIKCF